jgi:DNA replication protein
MILKRLYDEYDLAIERILLKEYKRLSLTMPEMSILLALFSIYKKRKTFSVSAISRRVEYNQNEIGKHVESLIEKGFMTLGLETTKDQKEREIFDLDLTFKKLETLYLEDEIEKQREHSQNNITKTIRLFEQSLGRLLLPYELETLRRWYDEQMYQHEQIISAIEQTVPRTSLKAVERILTQIIPKPIEIDEETENILDELYKKMR